mgnify:CR=1 FL=1
MADTPKHSVSVAGIVVDSDGWVVNNSPVAVALGLVNLARAVPILALTLLFLPTGLLGRHEVEKV